MVPTPALAPADAKVPPWVLASLPVPHASAATALSIAMARRRMKFAPTAAIASGDAAAALAVFPERVTKLRSTAALAAKPPPSASSPVATELSAIVRFVNSSNPARPPWVKMPPAASLPPRVDTPLLMIVESLTAMPLTSP